MCSVKILRYASLSYFNTEYIKTVQIKNRNLKLKVVIFEYSKYPNLSGIHELHFPSHFSILCSCTVVILYVNVAPVLVSWSSSKFQMEYKLERVEGGLYWSSNIIMC